MAENKKLIIGKILLQGKHKIQKKSLEKHRTSLWVERIGRSRFQRSYADQERKK